MEINKFYGIKRIYKLIGLEITTNPTKKFDAQKQFACGNQSLQMSHIYSNICN